MRKLVVLLFSLFSLVAFGQNKTCQDFKTGKFEYVDTSYADWKVCRTDAVQIETNTKSGLIIYSAVTWISDCEFTLTCTKVSKPKLQHVVGKIFEIEIVKTGNNTYYCISEKNEVQTKDLMLELVKIE
ncbi:hypothetical protein [Algibacter sp. 2305UL17-15]|uniref:hypothetical protein n=1 Tax=Algibacter sp. 2305UL17-15 TaxID=3231268 RepID=UPI00345AE34C